MNLYKTIQINLDRFWYLWLALTFLLSLFGAVLTVSAQEQDVDLDELINGHTHKVDVLLYSNLSFIEQTGDENKLTSIQEQQGRFSNFVNVKQLNQGNNAYIEQTGSGHGTLLLQDGVDNKANLKSDGHLSVTMAVQSGEKNTIESNIENYGMLPRGAYLEQNGNNNSINLDMKGGGSFVNLPLVAKITQVGSELSVNANLDGYDKPFYINQQSGPSGEGMLLNITTSDFYFPMK